MAWLRFMVNKWRGKPTLHILHIGKTGGSALNSAFSQHVHAAKFAVRFHDHNKTLKEIPKGEKVVFFLRHPVSRFISGFYSRKRLGRPRYYIPWSVDEAAAFSRFSSPNVLAKALSSADPALRADAVRAMRKIRFARDSFYQWFDSDDYFRNRLEDIILIGFQENLDRDFEELKVILGISDTAVLPADDFSAHRGLPSEDRELDEEAANNLHIWYKRDIHFYCLCQSVRAEQHNRSSRQRLCANHSEPTDPTPHSLNSR